MAKKIKICLTGSSGFIGKNLQEVLLKNNQIQVINFEGDLLNKEDITSFFKLNPGIDQIVHLAGTFFGDFQTLIKVNVLTLNNLLELAAQEGVKKIIFTSSGAVYGEPVGDCSIETDLLNPNTFYGIAKKFAEETIQYYAHNFGIQYVILRFPNVYGDGNDKGVIYNFLTDIKGKGEITVFGNGDQSRNFLHVADACDAIQKSIYYEKSDIFNISNPQKVSINELIRLLKEEYSFTVNYEPNNNNLKDLLLNIEKAEKWLKFHPSHIDIKIKF